MPNKYIYNRMESAEFDKIRGQLNLAISEVMKITGRHYNNILDYSDAHRPDVNPTTPEMLILLYLSAYPERVGDFLGIVEERITGQHRPQEPG